MNKKVIICSLCTLCALPVIGGCSAASTNETVADLPSETSTQSQQESNMFETTDFNGNVVTQDIFSDYDLTMINVWGSFCKPCIVEMPELQQVYENLPANVNLITVQSDSDIAKETGQEILTSNGVTIPTLEISSSLQASLLKDVIWLPTTIFVDSSGKIVGAPYEGERTQEGYLNSINEHLSLLN